MAVTPMPAVRLDAPLPVRSTADRARAIMGTHGGKMSRDQLVRDVKAGIIVSAPIEGIFESQKYRKGEIKANEYVARVIANSIGFGTWTIGGALAAAALAPLGAPAFVVAVAGFAAGMVANDIWDRTFGTAIVKVLKERLPESAAKPFADGFTKFVANPINDYIWKPVSGFAMKHKVMSGIALTLAACRFPKAAKAVFKEIGTMAVGTAAALGIQLGVLDRVLPQAEHRH